MCYGTGHSCAKIYYAHLIDATGIYLHICSYINVSPVGRPLQTICTKSSFLLKFLYVRND